MGSTLALAQLGQASSHQAHGAAAALHGRHVVRVPLRSATNHDNWVVDARIGDGPSRMPLSIDFGSSSTGVITDGCTHGCGGMWPSLQVPMLTAGASPPLPIRALYGDGSYGWQGFVTRQTIVLDGLPPIRLAMGAIVDNSLFERAGLARGILGLGPAALLLPNTEAYLVELAAQVPASAAFGVQLCNPNGWLYVGGVDAALLREPMAYTPLLAEDFWRIAPAALAIGGSELPVVRGTLGRWIVDNGIDQARLPTTLYRMVTDALAASPAFVALFSASFATEQIHCQPPPVGMTPSMIDDALPTLSLWLPRAEAGGDFEVRLTATQSYLSAYRASDGGIVAYCNRLAPTDGPATFSSPYMQGLVVEVDPAHGRLGMAHHRGCHEQDG